MESEAYKILFTKLREKVRQMRALQKKQAREKNWFPLQDKRRLWKLTNEVDDMMLLDEEGEKVFVKNSSHGKHSLS